MTDIANTLDLKLKTSAKDKSQTRKKYLLITFLIKNCYPK